jgi:hypothetical protein
MTINTVQSVTRLSDSWKDMQAKTESVHRTDIVAVPPANYSGGPIDLEIENHGQANLSDFAHWDLILQRAGSATTYIDQAANYPPGSGEWALKGIFVSEGQIEAFDLRILNPGEFAVLEVNPGDLIAPGETVKITVATSEGVTSQCFVSLPGP